MWVRRTSTLLKVRRTSVFPSNFSKTRQCGILSKLPSSYFMKSPPIQYHDDQVRQMVEDFIAGK